MKNILLLAFTLLLFANCGNAPKNAEKQPEIKIDTAKKEILSHWTTEEPKKVSRIVETDTIIKAFGEQFKMVWREEIGNYEHPNGVLTITNLKNKKIVAQDSIHLEFGLLLERKDYNRDGLKDILIHAYSGGRGANIFYYLYLSDIGNKTFHFVKNFDTEPSPEADTSGMVIYTAYLGLGSRKECRFYKIMYDYSMQEIGYNVEMQEVYVNTPADLKQEREDERKYRKAYNKAWAAFKKMK
jgi:hypothetical protein